MLYLFSRCFQIYVLFIKLDYMLKLGDVDLRIYLVLFLINYLELSSQFLSNYKQIVFSYVNTCYYYSSLFGFFFNCCL